MSKTLKEEIIMACRSFNDMLIHLPEPYKSHHFQIAAEDGARKALQLFMQRAREEAVKPDPNSWTRFAPYIDLADLERLVKEATGDL